MNEVFVGSELLSRGVLTRSRLRWNYTSIYPDVCVPDDVAPSLRQHTVSAWLWSGQRGIVAGRAAAALHGAVWVDVLPLGDRYRRARGRDRFALALDLMDGGAQSPRETALRLLVIDEGFLRDFCARYP